MRCYAFEDRLEAYLDGELDGRDAQKMQAHEAECARCRQMAQDARDVREILSQMGSEDPPEDLHANLMQAVREEAARGKPKRRRNPWVIAGIAAAAVLFVCVSVPLGAGMLSGFGMSGGSPQMNMAAGYGGVTPEMAAYDMAAATAAPQAAPSAKEGELLRMMEEPSADIAQYDMADDYAVEEAAGGIGGVGAATTGQAHGIKLIRTGYVSLESRAFDQDYQALLTMVATYEGYIESSSTSGVPYNADPNSFGRWANLTARIPSGALDAFLVDAKGVGNLLDASVYAQDVTASYQDTELRLATLRTQHQRLTELLKKAEQVEDLITLEGELSRVQYEMDSLTGHLRDWDSRVDYAQVSLSLNEVKTYSVDSGMDPSLGERVSQGFFKGINDFVEGLQNMLVFLVSALPVVLSVAIAGAVAFFLIRRLIKRRGKRPRGDADAPRFDE